MSVTGSIMAAAGLAGAGVSAYGANKAAKTQAQAAENAAGVERQNAIDALNFQKQVYGDQQRNIAPWLNTGTAAIGQLGRLMGLRLPPSSTLNPAYNPSLGGGDFGGNTIDRVSQLRDLLGGDGGGPLRMNAQGSAAPMNGGASVPMLNAGGPSTGGSPILNSILPGEAGTPSGPGAGGTANMGNPNLAVPRTDGGGTDTGNASAGNTDASFGSLAKPFGESFTAPTDVTEQNDPGFKFRLDQGMKALQNSAAARGGLMTGGTAKALNDYAQGSASNEYGNVYNRALGEFQQRYNIFNNDQNTLFNRLAALSGGGQTSAANLNSAGSNAAGNIGNILLTSGGQIGNNINNAGAARGSGYVGVGNAISGGLNNLGNLALLAKLYGGSGGTPNYPQSPDLLG